MFTSYLICKISNTHHLLMKIEVITGKSQTQALMYWPSDSEVNAWGPRSEISLWWPNIQLWWLSSLLILKKYLDASFYFSYWKYSCTLSIFSVVFAHALKAFTRNSKEPPSWENFSKYPVITRKYCPLSSQSEHAYYWSQIIITNNDIWAKSSFWSFGFTTCTLLYSINWLAACLLQLWQTVHIPLVLSLEHV